MKIRIGTALTVLFLIPALASIACAGFSPTAASPAPASQAAGAQPLSPTAVPVRNQPTAVPVPSPTPVPVQSRPTAVAVVVASTAAPPTAPAQGAGQVLPAGLGDLVLDQSVLEKVYNTVNPSVVNIQVIEPASLFGRRRFRGGQAIALGSGFVWDTQGHIVTNNHVVSGATSISVTFADNTSADATLVGADPNVDLAVIKIDVPAGRQLQPVRLADSAQVQVGQIAIAIGNPFGLQNTATLGIISALARTLPSGLDNANPLPNAPTYSIPDVIQTDASINPGNSGGVLVDLQGQVLGVTSALESATQSNSGVGFVIPSEIVNRVVPALIDKKGYQDPWIGIDGTDLNSAINRTMSLNSGQQGVLVTNVDTGSPADQAGLQAGSQTMPIDGQDTAIGGDVITAVNGQPVVQFNALNVYLVLHTAPGDKLTLTVLRQGQSLDVPVTVGTFPGQ